MDAHSAPPSYSNGIHLTMEGEFERKRVFAILRNTMSLSGGQIFVLILLFVAIGVVYFITKKRF